MSTRTTKPGRAIPGLELGGEPRVNLLPPEVTQGAKARSIRVRLSLLVVLALLIVGGAYGWATMQTAQVQARLAEARVVTESLLSEQAQYSDATSMATLVASSSATAALATSTEILWAPLFDKLTPLVPPGTSIYDVTAEARTPWEQPLAPTSELRQPREGSIQLVMWSASPTEATTFFNSASKLELVADSSIDIVELGVSAYETTITLNLTEDALSGRFDEEDTQ